MDDAPSFYERLGRLEGLIQGLHQSVTQSQNFFAAYITRIEQLEKRQIELERQMLTREELRDLVRRVENISSSQQKSIGEDEGTRWSIQQVLTVATVIVAALALLMTIVDRNPPDPPDAQPMFPQAKP